jgi:hypothetical protein
MENLISTPNPMGRGMGKISTRLLNGDGDENELPGGSKPVAIPTSGASFLNCVSQRPPQKIFWYILVFEYTFNLNTRNTNKYVLLYCFY